MAAGEAGDGLRQPVHAAGGFHQRGQTTVHVRIPLADAMSDDRVAAEVQRVFTAELFRVYRNNDVIGCEVAGALKNVMAIASGEAQAELTTLGRRAAAWVPAPPAAERGWVRLYTEHVLQADEGVDLDFLVGGSGDGVPKVAF